MMMSFKWLITWHLQLRWLAQKTVCPQLSSHEQWWQISNGTLKFQAEIFMASKQLYWQIAFPRCYRPPWGLSTCTKSGWSTFLKGAREMVDDSCSLGFKPETFWLLAQIVDATPHKTVKMSSAPNQNDFFFPLFTSLFNMAMVVFPIKGFCCVHWHGQIIDCVKTLNKVFAWHRSWFSGLTRF